MGMKNLLLAILAVSMNVLAADTTDSFSGGTCYGTVCVSLTGDAPDLTIDYVSVPVFSSTLAASVDGVVYSSGLGAAMYAFDPVSGYYVASDVPLYASVNGTSILGSVTVRYWTTRVVSGRGAGHITPHYAIVAGTLTLP
jgi:hypothetical protein